MKQLFLIFGFLVFFKATEGGLISQSSIQSCDWGDSNEPTTKDGGGCKEKFVVSMTLKSGQGESEALYANVHQVQTSRDSEPSSLEKPFRIEIRKSQTITNYRVYYRGSVNGLPHEDTRIFSRPSHCHDGWYEKQPSCNKQRSLDNNGEFAWDSQGFCCRCSAYIREIRRPNGTCFGGIAEWFKHGGASGYTTYGGRKTSFGSSAHCMRMNDLWYDVYDIELPNMLYNITVRLLQYEGRIVDTEKGTEMANWTTVSTFYLSPSKTMGRSADGKVVVELQGDLVGANGPLDFSAKKLLIPTLKVWKLDKNPTPPPAYTNGPSDWLLVDDNLVDLSGKQCNKVGVSYTGFKRQNSPCDKPVHSCFTNQPLQLWKHDEELRKIGKRGHYMVHNFGKIHPSTHVTDHSFILRFINTDLHNTFVTFRIDAADIVFVYNVAKGRIVDAYATKFTAVKEVGQLFVEVENTGQLESEYSVVLSKCLGRQSIPSKVISILPGRIANVSFSLQSYKTKGETSLCEVQLFDKSFNLLGSSKVDVSVEGACFCFGECGCTCGSGTKGSVGNSTALPCPTPPPVVVSKRNLALDIFFLVLESIGIHGIVGFFGGILLFLGCIKLMCGGILCCRKTKAQEHYDNMIKKGVDPKSPTLVKCTGECRGAKAALARYKRKLERLKKMGKDPGILDDWRNTSYECGCKDELADIRFAYILRALCFYYYCFILPFIWLGKKIWWGVFKDTAAKKEAAEKVVINAANKKGKMEKYGIVDIEAELKNIEKERIELRGETGSEGQKTESTVATKRDQAITRQPRETTVHLHMRNFNGDNGLGQSNNSKSKKVSKREKLETNAQSFSKKKGKSGTSRGNKYESEKSRSVKKPANTHGRSTANKAQPNIDKQQRSPPSLPNNDQTSCPQTISQQHSQEKSVNVENSLKSDASGKPADHRCSLGSATSLHTAEEQGVQLDEHGVQNLSELTEAQVNLSHSGDHVNSNLSGNEAGITISELNLNPEKQSLSKMSSKESRSASSSDQCTGRSPKTSIIVDSTKSNSSSTGFRAMNLDPLKKSSSKMSSKGSRSASSSDQCTGSSSITDSTKSSFSRTGSTKSNTKSSSSDNSITDSTKSSSSSIGSANSKSTNTESTKSDSEHPEDLSSPSMASHGSSDNESHSGSTMSRSTNTESKTSSSEQLKEELQSSSVSESCGLSESDSESHSSLSSGHSSDSFTCSESEQEGSSSTSDNIENSHATSSKSQSSSSLQS